MDQNLWQMCCYVVCFGNASRTISEQYCADIPMMIDTLRKSVASSAATARKAGKMPSMECIEFIRYLDYLRTEADIDPHDRILFERINERLAEIQDEFLEGAYSIYEKEVCSISDRFYTKRHK